MGYGGEIGPGGRIRTRTGSVLSGVPLLLGYAGQNENDLPEAEPDAPRGRSRINLRRIPHRLAHFAMGDLAAESEEMFVEVVLSVEHGVIVGCEMVLPVGIAPTTRRFEAGRSDLLSYGSLLKWCAGAVLPRLPPQCRCGDLLIDLPARGAA